MYTLFCMLVRQNPKKNHQVFLPGLQERDEMLQPWLCHITWLKGFCYAAKVTDELTTLIQREMIQVCPV